jgi:hypothetical protein
LQLSPLAHRVSSTIVDRAALLASAFVTLRHRLLMFAAFSKAVSLEMSPAEIVSQAVHSVFGGEQRIKFFRS